MAPAAWHRRLEPSSVSRRFIDLSSRCLLASMFPLSIAIALEIFLISDIILKNELWSIIVSASSLLGFLTLWLLAPGRLGSSRHR